MNTKSSPAISIWAERPLNHGATPASHPNLPVDQHPCCKWVACGTEEPGMVLLGVDGRPIISSYRCGIYCTLVVLVLRHGLWPFKMASVCSNPLPGYLLPHTAHNKPQCCSGRLSSASSPQPSSFLSSLSLSSSQIMARAHC